ncbi:hypothetical protein GOV06_01105 [Candidatus Woesearchaeota archaeon]|nr:hypothetical protein [Candidatus Woesearchaeota archaeon]
MAIVGFNFTKIKVERKDMILKGKIDIKNNIVIVNVEESKLSIGDSSQKVAKFSFDFNSSYEPKAGSIRLSGDIMYLGEAAKIEELVNGWKKDKKVPKEIMAAVLNVALNKSNVQALVLSQLINLPSPIPLPKVEVGTAKEKKE